MEYNFQYHKAIAIGIYFFSFDSAQDYFRKDLVKLLHAKTVVRVFLLSLWVHCTVESPKGKKEHNVIFHEAF